MIAVGGFDPSGGAGLLADAKTIEQHGVPGLGVCTALTYQNENTIEKIDWLTNEQVILQLKVLFEKYFPAVAKIGIVRDAEMLNAIIEFLLSKNKNIRIIWDPVVASSSGFDFHSGKNNWMSALKNIFLITPNIPEAKAITGIDDEERAAVFLAKQCNVLLKGGHSSSDTSNDLLFENSPLPRRGGRGEDVSKNDFEKIISISGEKFSRTKHGTGCVLSSAIASNLTLGKNLEESCRAAKEYVTQFILSNDGLLGSHHQINISHEQII